MLKIKNIVITFIFFSLSTVTYCAAPPVNSWSDKTLEQQFLKAQRDNNLLLQAGSNIAQQSVKGTIDAVSNAASGSLVEWAKKELDLMYDPYPTEEVTLERFNKRMVLINNTIELIPKNAKFETDNINEKITKLKYSKESSSQQDILNLEQEVEKIKLQERNDLTELRTLRRGIMEEYIKHQKGSSSTKQTSSDTSVKTETDKKAGSNTPGETPKTEPASTEVTPKKDLDKKTEKTSDNKGFIAKLGALLCPPIVAQGLDAIAQTCGVQTVAQWLAAQSPLLTGKETTISRTLTATGAALISVALYKAYQIFSSEEEDDEDGLDIFSEDFNVNNNKK